MAGRDFIKTTLTIPPDLYEKEKAVTGTDFPGNKRGLDVAIAGGTVGIIPSGLTIGGLISKVTINNTSWTPLPTTPQTDRNTIAIQNKSGGTIYVNFDPLAPSPLLDPYSSWEVTDGGSVSYGIKDTILLYAWSVAASATITVKELA